MTHYIKDGKFVCTADRTAPCRNYPACDCEQWTRELHGQKFGQVIGFSRGRPLYSDTEVAPLPGHENVQQDECWLEGWMTASHLRESYEDHTILDDDEFPDGEIDYTWHGDYLTWEYKNPEVARRAVVTL